MSRCSVSGGINPVKVGRVQYYSCVKDLVPVMYIDMYDQVVMSAWTLAGIFMLILLSSIRSEFYS